MNIRTQVLLTILSAIVISPLLAIAISVGVTNFQAVAQQQNASTTMANQTGAMANQTGSTMQNQSASPTPTPTTTMTNQTTANQTGGSAMAEQLKPLQTQIDNARDSLRNNNTAKGLQDLNSADSELLKITQKLQSGGAAAMANITADDLQPLRDNLNAAREAFQDNDNSAAYEALSDADNELFKVTNEQPADIENADDDEEGG